MITEDIEKLKEQLQNTPDDFIVLIETTADKYLEVSMAAVKYLAQKNDKGIVISVNRPYNNLTKMYKNNDIDVSKMFVIDCISKTQNGHADDTNVSYMENASSLTDISLSISEKLNNGNNGGFVFFDSIATMLIHNQPYIFARFMHSIFTKMRIKGVGGLLISIEDKTHKEIRAEIAQLCDKVIKI